MTSSQSDKIKRTYETASHQREAAQNLSGDAWAEFQAIREKYSGQRRFERRNYDLEYKTRFEAARKKLIDKAGSKTKKLAHPWFGVDVFDSGAIERQAHRNVQHAHENQISDLNRQENEEVNDLLDRPGNRKELREKPKRDFEKAADRRVGKERRKDVPQPRPRPRTR